MSLIAEIAGVVRKRFADEVAAPESLPVIYDNTQGVNEQHPADTRWCRLAVRIGVCTQVANGGPGRRLMRTDGVALVTLLEPLGVGDGEQLQLVGVIQDAFRHAEVPGPPFLRFRSPYPAAPPQRDGSWWVVPINIPFEADEYV